MCAGTAVVERGDLETAVARAVAAEVPEAVVREARDIALAKFGRGSERAGAYFWGVLRRRALRGQAPALARWLVISSFAAELLDAGHTEASVYSELVRVFGPSAGRWLLETHRPTAGRAA